MKNKSLNSRIISLLIELNKHKFNTLDILFKATKIPKPSLHRLLLELIEMQLVIKHLDTHIYSVTSACRLLSDGASDELRFIEQASLIARQLTEQHEWPVAIASVEQNQIQIRFSSRPDARFSFIKSTVGKCFPLIGSALGEAWLAQRHRREQNRLLNTLPAALVQRRLQQVNCTQICNYLDNVKQQGYAVRIGQSGESSHLAVPLYQGKRLKGVMGMSVFSTVVGEQIVTLYLAALQEAARQLANS